jgi:hypothetical protein
MPHLVFACAQWLGVVIMREIEQWDAPTPKEFREEIIPRGLPAVLRGIAGGWPLVAEARRDPARCMAILAANATNEPVEILRAEPTEEGRFHYAADGLSLNFLRGRASLQVFLAMLREQAAAERPFAMIAQGLIAGRYVPGFQASHAIPLVPDRAEPRLWIGNAAKVATHNDPVDNVAVVAAGRRRFTLFPSEAEEQLYMGPAHPTPAGTPISMVHVTAPDLQRYPRFADALEMAQQAELAAGDAVFIPKNWFHHVEALDRFNVLVNYWWDSGAED